jgi:hypothetical protein
MRGGTKRMGGWCVVLLVALFLPGAPAWAGPGKGRADLLCEKAETAERDARGAERESEKRRRFLSGKGLPIRNDSAQGGDSAAARQSVKAKIAQARAVLPQLRQGAAAASQDRGAVPGLDQYFLQMESTIGRTLQAVESCIDNPEFCSIPPVSCPSPPPMPVITNASASFVRQVQQSYAQGANMARQACMNLNGELLGEVERLKRESRAAAPKVESPGSAQGERFGEADLNLRRAESLKREAVKYRQEADRESGVAGYCGARSRIRADEPSPHDAAPPLKPAGKPEDPPDAGHRADPVVGDLKAGWEQKWEKGNALGSAVPPLPKLSGGVGGEPATVGTGDAPVDGGPSWRDQAMDQLRNAKSMVERDGAWVRDKALVPYEKAKAWYQEADRQVELTEFIKERPKELLKDAVTELVEHSLGAYGKTVTTGYKILGAVKTTSDEVGQILVDAPQVLATGTVAEARDLAGRANRVPLNFMNSVFDDVTGKFPPPRYDKEGVRK